MTYCLHQWGAEGVRRSRRLLTGAESWNRRASPSQRRKRGRITLVFSKTIRRMLWAPEPRNTAQCGRLN